MITTFEQQTAPLTKDEIRLVDLLVRGFRTKTKDNPIKAPEVCEKINADYHRYGLSAKITEPRFRKLCNYIRRNGILPLIATSSGYYCSTDREEILRQIESMRQRSSAIESAASGMEAYLKQLDNQTLFN